MKFEWNYESGYVNREPWREFEIPDEELEDLTEIEIEDLMYEYAEEEFHNRIQLLVRKKDETL